MQIPVGRTTDLPSITRSRHYTPGRVFSWTKPVNCPNCQDPTGDTPGFCDHCWSKLVQKKIEVAQAKYYREWEEECGQFERGYRGFAVRNRIAEYL